ncbi:uncharacterized protein LOC110034168 [Phalaenopsis equestris]|uniref:uncharacterized protein LOC110034168 n=1 Tax=Phalaenopsis equestris TaxID=78828 RepID=UPI0009E6294C|nr:uncharacterized protein LOC110034168 [Phalaenopsis equestris]
MIAVWQQDRSKLCRSLRVIIFWFIWCARNTCKHGGKIFSSSNCFYYIKGFIYKMLKYGKFKSSCNSNVKHMLLKFSIDLPRNSKADIILVHWVVPVGGYIKINMDGSWTPAAGIGGICRDSFGKASMWFSAPALASSVIEAEAEVIMGLELALKHGWNSLEIEMDSFDLWSFCYRNRDYRWNLMIHLKRIFALTIGIQVRWFFIHREGNKCVDWAAKQGMKTQKAIFTNKFPEILNCFIRGDMMDSPYIRTSS